MRRHLLGIIALSLLAGGTWLWMTGESGDGSAGVGGVAIRAGAVLAAIWLAMPQVSQLFKRFPPWMLACLVVISLIAVVRAKTLLILGPLMGLIIALQWLGIFLPKRPGHASQPRGRPARKKNSGSPSAGSKPAGSKSAGSKSAGSKQAGSPPSK